MRLPFFRDLDPTDSDAWVQRRPGNLESSVNRGVLVKLAFFGGLDTLQRVEDPRRAVESPPRLARILRNRRAPQAWRRRTQSIEASIPPSASGPCRCSVCGRTCSQHLKIRFAVLDSNPSDRIVVN